MSSQELVEERTHILPKVPAAPLASENKSNGANLASQLPEFSVQETSEGDDLPKRTLVLEDTPKNGEKSSITFTSFNYINSIVGSGVIGMPLALYQSGIVLGFFTLLFVAIATDACLILMIRAGRIVEANNYQELVKSSFGTPMFLLQSFLQFMYPFIALISYNIIIGDTMTKVLIRVTGISPQSVVVQREFVVVACTLLITLPLSLYRNIARLAKVSMVSVFLVVSIAVVMLYRLYSMWSVVPSTEDAWDVARPRIASSIGIMSFAFMCHHSSFMVYESLYDNTVERWSKTTHISIGISGVLAGIYAYAGYITFTGHVQGDIFENYCWRDDLMNICRGLYAVTILFTYPIECFVAREVIENAFFDQSKERPILRHAVLTVLIAIIGMGISLSTDCLGTVLELNGLFCAIPLAYIIPAMCFIRLEEGSLFGRPKLVAWGLIAFGIITMCVGIGTMIFESGPHATCSHGEQMSYCMSSNETHTTNAF